MDLLQQKKVMILYNIRRLNPKQTVSACQIDHWIDVENEVLLDVFRYYDQNYLTA